MTFKELVEYAKKVGVPDRAFKEAFAPLIARENKVLDDLEALVAMAECDRQAEYWKKVEKIIIRNRAERKERMK